MYSVGTLAAIDISWGNRWFQNGYVVRKSTGTWLTLGILGYTNVSMHFGGVRSKVASSVAWLYAWLSCWDMILLLAEINHAFRTLAHAAYRLEKLFEPRNASCKAVCKFPIIEGMTCSSIATP